MTAPGRSDAEVVTALEARPGPVGEAMRAYMAVVGLRVLGGYDIADVMAANIPS